jgi:hypothetical protein
MGKVHLAVHGREASSGLVGRKGRGSNIGARVCVLADLTGLGNLFEVLYVSWR